MKLSAIRLILLLLIFLVINMVLKKVGELYFSETLTGFLIYKATFRLILALWTCFILAKLKLYRFADINRNIVVSIVSIILLITVSSIYVTKQLALPIADERQLLFFFATVSTGFFEETFSRLLVFGMLYCILVQYGGKKQYQKAILYSSLIFGFLHLGNLFTTDLLSVFNQAILAIGVGYLLQALLVKTKNITLLIFIHSTINYIGSYRVLEDFYKNDSADITSMTALEVSVNIGVFAFFVVILIFIGDMILRMPGSRLEVKCPE